MSVLSDPATYGILNSELTNCARTAAFAGRERESSTMATDDGSLQRVEQETVSSQSLPNAIDNKTRHGSMRQEIDCD